MIAFDAGECNSKLDAGARKSIFSFVQICAILNNFKCARKSESNKRLVPKRLILSQHFIELRKIQSSFSKKNAMFFPKFCMHNTSKPDQRIV